MADFPDTLTIDVEFPDLDVDILANYPGQNGVTTTPLSVISTVGIGARGPAGPPPNLTIGSVTSGTTPVVSIDQISPGNYAIDFVLKEGPPGANSTVPGPANSLAIGTVTSGPTSSATITGTAPNQTLNLVLQPGAASTVPGPANTLSIGSVTSGPANASITGTAPNQTLNLTLPPGTNGATPTIVSGTVSTLPPGASATASLTATGTPNEYALNLGLPSGPPGSGSGDVNGPAGTTDSYVALFDGPTGKLLKGVAASALKTMLALVKSDVGLGNVDNTSDANKPVSTAQQAALDLKAPLASPALTGTPTSPTAAVDTSTTQIASTAFVLGQAGSATPLVDGTAAVGTSTRFARQDHVHPTDTSRAALASPTFTGTPAAPTAAADTNTTQLATTAFVLGQASATTPVVNGTAAVGTSARYARADHVHPTDTTRAALASPAFTGTPTAPTATAGTSTTQLATTAFVTTADNLKAPLASPALTGTPTAPTAANGTNTTQIATTAFVLANAAPAGAPVSSKSTAYTVVAGDSGKVIECTATLTLSLTAAATLGNGFLFYVRMSANGGVVTIDPNASELIDGVTTAAGYIGDGVFTVYCDGSSFRTSRRKGLVLVNKTTVAASVASVDFEVGFSDAEMIAMDFELSAIATTDSFGRFAARVKKSGTYQTNGYIGSWLRTSASSLTTAQTDGSIVELTNNLNGSSNQISGRFSISGINSTSAGGQILLGDFMDSDETNNSGSFGIARAMQTTAAAAGGIRFLSASGGNVTAGTIAQYGRRG